MRRLFGALAFLVVMLCAATLFAQSRRYAVVIGANSGDADEVALRYAERDAKRFARVMQKLGDVDEQDMVVLLGANAQTVEKTLETITDDIGSRPEEDSVLYVYYSGHADSRSIHLNGTRLAFSSIKTILEYESSDVRVMIIDACRSGDVTRVKGAVPTQPFKLDASGWNLGKGLAILTSSAQGEDAQESEKLKGSFFTHYLVSGLRGAADSSKDGVVTLSEAYGYAYRETLRSTSRAATVQHPTYAFDVKGRRDLAMTRLRSKHQEMGQLRFAAPGSYLVFSRSSSGSIVAEVSVENDAEIALSEGDYFVRRRYQGGLYELETEVLGDHKTTLEASAMESVPIGKVARKGADDSVTSAWSIMGGGGLSSEILPETSVMPLGMLGIQVDMQPLSLQLRARYGQSTGGQFTTVQNDLLGGDLSILSGFDFERIFVGAGLRGGADVLMQTFPQDDLKANRATVGRLSAFGTVNVSVTTWMTIFVEPAIDAYIVNVANELGEQPSNTLRWVPSGVAGLLIYL